jgi:hypothetical protein
LGQGQQSNAMKLARSVKGAYRAALVLTGLVALQGCATHRVYTWHEAQALCSTQGDCAQLRPAKTVKLTPQEECWVDLLRRRCLPYDQAVLGCLLQEHTDGGLCWESFTMFPGGGCTMHMCSQERPSGSDACGS